GESGRPSGPELLGIEREVADVRGDLRDAALVTRALEQGEGEAGFHLAARGIFGPAAGAPAETFDVNVRGTWTLLEACRERGVRSVVVASSDKADGPPAQLRYRG